MSSGPQMPAMPLSMVKAGETVHVSRVKGNEDMKHHLKDLEWRQHHRHGARRSLWNRFQSCHAHNDRRLATAYRNKTERGTRE